MTPRNTDTGGQKGQDPVDQAVRRLAILAVRWALEERRRVADTVRSAGEGGT